MSKFDIKNGIKKKFLFYSSMTILVFGALLLLVTYIILKYKNILDGGSWIIDAIIIFTALLLLAQIGLIMIFSKRIIKLIKYLDKSLRNFGKKDFNIRLPEENYNGYPLYEFKELYKTFNLMAESVYRHNEDIMNQFIRQLYIDEMTGLPNRQKLMIETQKADKPVLFLINIDYFKEINDFYGNVCGDQMLIQVTNKLSRLLPDESFRLYKMPADEYAILLNSSMEVIEVEKFAKHICDEISDTAFKFKDNDIYIKVTIGITITEELEGQILWMDIIKDADMALKTARKMNKSMEIYDKDMDIVKQYENNIKWSKLLKEAIQEDRIVPYFQPIYNNHTGKIEKYECLVRLLSLDGGVISPYYFVDIAKKTKLYHELTKIMIDKSFEVFYNTDYEFSINLSAIDILDADTNDYIKEKLTEYKGIGKKLVFEILESEGIENFDRVKEFIDKVKSFGCKIAIDDFGTGYSNFEYILKLNVDYIKLDASLTKNLDTDKNSQIITKTIADFSKQLGVKTISEFVHSKEVYDKEKMLGVDYSQGYYFGKPSNHIEKKLEKKRN